MTTKLWREFTRLRDCLQSIADAPMDEPREPDDADWRERALECQRCAKAALAASTFPPAERGAVEKTGDGQ